MKFNLTSAALLFLYATGGSSRPLAGDAEHTSGLVASIQQPGAVDVAETSVIETRNTYRPRFPFTRRVQSANKPKYVDPKSFDSAANKKYRKLMDTYDQLTGQALDEAVDDIADNFLEIKDDGQATNNKTIFHTQLQRTGPDDKRRENGPLADDISLASGMINVGQSFNGYGNFPFDTQEAPMEGASPAQMHNWFRVTSRAMARQARGVAYIISDEQDPAKARGANTAYLGIFGSDEFPEIKASGKVTTIVQVSNANAQKAKDEKRALKPSDGTVYWERQEANTER